MPSTGGNSILSVRLFASAALLAVLAVATAGCQTTQTTETTGSLPLAPPDRPDADWRQDVQVYGEKYRASPANIDVAMRYAQALRATGQRAQAVAVLERLSIENPHDKAVLGAYGRALAEAGDYGQALEVLERAHTPDQPDWHILSAQGAVLDQMGRHADAQRYYLTALKIVPDEPSVLSNLGLSYALSKNLPRGRDDVTPGGSAASGQFAGAAEPRTRRRPARPFRGSADHRARRSATRRGCRQRRLSAADAGSPRRRSLVHSFFPRRRRSGRFKHGAKFFWIPAAAGMNRDGDYCSPMTQIAAGPRMTTNSTGRKNKIIGTVSFGGRPAAFFSASDMRISRFSCDNTRMVVPSAVP